MTYMQWKAKRKYYYKSFLKVKVSNTDNSMNVHKNGGECYQEPHLLLATYVIKIGQTFQN